MEELLAHLAMFTVLPLLLGAGIVLFDHTAVGRVRAAEAFLIPLFIVGVGGSGISGFIADVFFPDPGSTSAGTDPGRPFQPQVGFAHLAMGLLGAIAAERRDGFREATVVAATMLSFGATLAHLVGGEAAANLTRGGTSLRDISSLATAALLIWFLLALRRAEGAEPPPSIVLRGWLIPVRRGSVAAVAVSAVVLPVAYGTEQAVFWSLTGVGVAMAAFWWIVRRRPSHPNTTRSA